MKAKIILQRRRKSGKKKKKKTMKRVWKQVVCGIRLESTFFSVFARFPTEPDVHVRSPTRRFEGFYLQFLLVQSIDGYSFSSYCLFHLRPASWCLRCTLNLLAYIS